MSATGSLSPEDAIAVQLDQQISSLESQISALRAQRELQVATILSSHAQSTKSILPADPSLLAASKSQNLHNQTNLYRACSSLTTFRIRDPDPHAVDNQRVLGIRIDVCSAGKFLRPYYVMLNKPFPRSDAFRVHKHTLPPCMHVEELAARYLPAPRDGSREYTKRAPPKQNLTRFIRALRREVVGYQNRAGVIKGLRREFGVDERVSRKGKARERVIRDVAAADAEAKQVRIEWMDGRVGRVVVGDKGEVLRCVVTGEDGRDWETERRIHGEGDEDATSMMGIGARLKEGIY